MIVRLLSLGSVSFARASIKKPWPFVASAVSSTAKRLKPSPEVKDLPQTEWGVLILSEMTDEQKAGFYKLIGEWIIPYFSKRDGAKQHDKHHTDEGYPKICHRSKNKRSRSSLADLSQIGAQTNTCHRG